MQDVQWNDSDYADGAKVFTTNQHFGNQAELARKIHTFGLHYVIIVVSIGPPVISMSDSVGFCRIFDEFIPFHFFFQF